jgi:uncharacterized protein (TIGR00297 family)
MNAPEWIILCFLACAMFLSVITRKLTITGSLTGGIVGYFIYRGAGYMGIGMIGAFFILGSAASSWKLKLKEAAGLAEENKGRRTAGQVFANGGVAGMAGLLAWLLPCHGEELRLMMAASLASATADTLSSELGNVYGRRFYNIVTFRKDARGLNGVVSLEGTLCGLAGSLLIAFIYALETGWSMDICYICLAGTIGNLADSILGATVERKYYLNNNAVNFLNTLIAAMCMLLFIYLQECNAASRHKFLNFKRNSPDYYVNKDPVHSGFLHPYLLFFPPI